MLLCVPVHQAYLGVKAFQQWLRGRFIHTDTSAEEGKEERKEAGKTH